MTVNNLNNYKKLINISLKETSKICLVVANEFWVLLLGVKNEKLGIRLQKNICPKKKDEI